MPNAPIKILIVDDSGLMRLLITNMLAEEPDLLIVGTAENGKEALEKNRLLQPDVILLDLVMKDYDGLYTIKAVMQEKPKPIIILSSVGNVNPPMVLEALQMGAYGFVNKPEGAFNSKVRDVKPQLLSKIRHAASLDPNLLKKQTGKNNNFPHTFESELNYGVIVIGASTGGTAAIEKILQKIPCNLPIPILIIQHIPPEFGSSFAKRLDELSPFRVVIAENMDELKDNYVYIAHSDFNTELAYHPITNKIIFKATQKQFPEYNFPSVDCLMLSAAEFYRERTIGVILTGMGRDGTLGLQKIFELGGYTIAQDEKTSVVFGMPKSAINQGVVKQVLPLDEISSFIVSCLA